MSDLKRLEQGMIRAYESGDMNAAKTLGAEIRKLQTSKTPQSESGRKRTFLGSINERIASVLGAPIQVGYELTDLATRPFVEDQADTGFSGKELVAGKMRQAGIDVSRPEDEETFGGRAGRLTFDTLATAVPLVKGAQIAAKGTGALARASKGLLDSIGRYPFRTAAAEGGSILGASAAGEMAEEAGASEGGQLTAELAGGVATPMALSTPMSIAVRKGAGALRGAGEGLGIVPEVGATGAASMPGGRRAAKRMQELVGDTEAARRALQDPDLQDLTPAQRIGTPEVIAAEKRAVGVDPSIRQGMDQEDLQRLSNLKDEISPVLPSGKAREYLEARRDMLTGALEKRASEAVSRAEEKISKLSPQMRASEASKIMRDEIENVFTRAKTREAELWGAVPNAGIPTAGLKSTFMDIVENTPAAMRDDIPDVAQRLLMKGGGFKPAENIKELQGLRSKLLEESRTARAAGNYNKARISDQIADAVLDEMGASSDNITGPVGSAIREALDYSRYIKQTFGQGQIGRVLGTDRTGAGRIEPEMVGRALFGSSGRERAAAGARRTFDAVDTPQMRAAVEQNMLNSFQQTAVKEGRLNTGSAEKWMRNNADVLDEFPQMREQITEAIRAENLAKGASISNRQIGSNLSSAQKSATAQYLEAPIGREIDRLISSKNPEKTTDDLLRLLRRDPDALEGLKSAAIENLMRKSGSGEVTDFGIETISGDKLLKNLNDMKARKVYEKILGSDGIRRAEEIAFKMRKIEKARKIQPAKTIMDDVISSVLQMPARILGAQAGRRVAELTGGGTVQTPGIMSEQARSLVNNLTRDKGEELIIQAMKDEKLMDALLQDLTTKQGQDIAFKKLNAWLASPAGSLLMMEEGE